MGIASFFGKLVGSGVTETASGIADVIDRFVETKEEKEAASMLRMKIQQKPDEWQSEINKISAAHRSIFVAGWRPFIGWVCGVGIAMHYVLSPIMVWTGDLLGKTLTAPSLEVGALMSLLLGMLGMGATRTYEKKHGLTK